MKLITQTGTFSLFKIPFDTFSLTQDKPYPMRHIVKRENVLGPDGKANFNEYWYKGILIDGEYYGFKLDENT